MNGIKVLFHKVTDTDIAIFLSGLNHHIQLLAGEDREDVVIEQKDIKISKISPQDTHLFLPVPPGISLWDQLLFIVEYLHESVDDLCQHRKSCPVSIARSIVSIEFCRDR